MSRAIHILRAVLHAALLGLAAPLSAQTPPVTQAAPAAVTPAPDARPSVLASRLLPPAEQVGLVGGDGPGDRVMNAAMRTQLAHLAPGRVVDVTTRAWILFGTSALTLQTLLIVGLVAERRRRRDSERHLANRLVRQALIADISTDLANLTSDDVDAQITASLAHVGAVLDVSECAMWAIDEDAGPCLFSRWRVPAGGFTASIFDEALISWAAPHLLQDEVVYIDDVTGVLDVSVPHGHQPGTSALMLPLRVDGRVLGILSVQHSRSRDWSEKVADDVRTVGEIIATAVVRKRTDASMRHQLDTLAHVNRVSGLGELAASLAHELNQPLAAILSNAEAAQQLLARPDPPAQDVREILLDVIADNERAAGIIRHMRTMLRKQRVVAVDVDVNDVVSEVTRLVQHDARLRGSSLDVVLGHDVPTVTMDATQLKQVLLNLVVNATDAMAQAKSGHPVELCTLASDGGLLIEVRDHGPGIPSGAERHLFDPFFTTKSDGLGVGLAITRSIVEAAGGRISGHNVPAGDAVFRVWLPSAGARTAA